MIANCREFDCWDHINPSVVIVGQQDMKIALENSKNDAKPWRLK